MDFDNSRVDDVILTNVQEETVISFIAQYIDLDCNLKFHPIIQHSRRQISIENVLVCKTCAKEMRSFRFIEIQFFL